MNKIITAFALVTLAGTALAAKPGGEPPPEPEQPAQVAFVGFSDTVLNGGQGFISMHDACDASYPGARMCTSEQFIESPTYAAATGEAWIRFSAVPTGGGFIDMSGLNSNSRDFTCEGWSNGTLNTRYGLTVDGDGRFGANNCHLPVPVACCL